MGHRIRHYSWLAAIFLVSCQARQVALQKDQVLSLGEMHVVNRGVPFVIAAPHGEFDTHSAEVVDALCESLPWSCIVVRGYRTKEKPINVNRPTEGLTKDTEKPSSDATHVYNEYSKNVDKLFGNGSKLYVEIHGNARPESQDRIEIAQVGLSASSIARLRKLLYANLEKQGLSQYRILIEGDPGFHYNATSAKKFGILRKVKRALHIETPLTLRNEKREALVKFLAGALSETTTMR